METGQKAFPIWYRAYVIVPFLAVAYFTLPLRWNFSPHALTHTLPAFLLGATDYGSGNMYTFLKFVFWLTLLLGACANALCNHPPTKAIMPALLWRLRQNLWHISTALCPAIGLTVLSGGKMNDDLIDMWLLTCYAIVGALVVLFMAVAGQRRAWSTRIRILWALPVPIAWGFVPVALSRP